MTKRSVDEALAVDSGANNGRSRSKDSRLSPADDDNSHPPRLVGSVSSLSSSPCSTSTAPPSDPPPGTTKPARRIVSSISSSSIIGGAATQADRKCGSHGTLENTTPVRQLTRLTNARILQRDGTLLPGSMTIDPSSGLIMDINIEKDLVKVSNDGEIGKFDDCNGQIVSPGFIDIQLNGAYGVDFSNDGTAIQSQRDSTDNHGQQTHCIGTNDVFHVAQRLVETGVTSFCPTMISSSCQTYRCILPLMRSARNQQQDLQHSLCESDKVGANILGMHLEGPFFAPSKGGAHDRQNIVAPLKGMISVEEVFGIDKNAGVDASQLDDIDVITLAPELPGALDATQSLTKLDPSTPSEINPHSIVVSCGHTEATYEDGVQALSHGATLLTHLYNAMNPFHHRKPGLVGLLSSQSKLGRMGLKRPFFSMIVDGIHVHESAVCMAYRSHPQGCVLVTDAMAAMGLGDGDHHLGSMEVCVKGGRATLAGTDTLAGSVVSMDTCVKLFQQYTGCSIGEALLCATLHPAMVLKRHVTRHRMSRGSIVVDAPIGILEVGSKADLVMLNNELDVLGTWVGGKKC
mmetsp:Transcript_50694/g.108021  ORF Transcript_50694/g.108021 Transcript_50694/m.108021 type:complete len:574 (-) Transcript_50694:223-1944(-)